MPDHEPLKSTDVSPNGHRGGFIALAVVAAAIGAGAALLLGPEQKFRPRKSRSRSRAEKRIVALAGILVGAGLTALLAPESGPVTRKRLSGTFSRIKVGAIDRIERIRLSKVPNTTSEDTPVRSVQELGRDPNNVF
jgi:gas vesicle protein